MTQAFNLGQLANKVNVSGQLDASTGLVNSTAVANGGTGRATLDTGKVLLGAGTSQVNMLAGTTTNDVLLWSGSAWISSPVATAGAGGGYALAAYTSPSSYTKPASLKSIKVTVVAAGGNGGASGTAGNTPGSGGGGGGGGSSIYYAAAPALPASAITITAGAGTNSFGAIASATAGSAGGVAATGGNGAGGVGGIGSGGNINIRGSAGNLGMPGSLGGPGGSSTMGGGGQSNAGAGGVYGGGGAGSAKGGSPFSVVPVTPGGAGANGIVIIEEFF